MITLASFSPKSVSKAFASDTFSTFGIISINKYLYNSKGFTMTDNDKTLLYPTLKTGLIPQNYLYICFDFPTVIYSIVRTYGPACTCKVLSTVAPSNFSFGVCGDILPL